MKYVTMMTATNWTRVLIIALCFGFLSRANAQRAGPLTAKILSNPLVTEDETEFQQAKIFDPGTGVISIRHRLWRTGIYHRKLERFILFHHPMHQLVFPIHGSVNGLPDSLASPSGMPLEELGDGRMGRTFRLAFLDPGVYVLQVEWTLGWRDRAGAFQLVRSNPIVLFVKPSPDYELQARRRAKSDPRRDEHGIELQEKLEQYYDERQDDSDFGAVVLSVVE